MYLISYLIFPVFLPLVKPFNVEWRYPIIIKNLGGVKSSDYFGASVSFLQADTGPTWVIIGAPKANSTLAVSSDIHEPGVIWQCSLGPQRETCREVQMDLPGTPKEWTDEGGLGSLGAMAIDSKSFVACASRWEKRYYDTSGKAEKAFMNGICYRRPRSDLFQETIPPLDPNKYQLKPLDELIYEDTNQKNSQAGFVAHIPKTGNEILMGAPGLEQWRGSVIQYLSQDGGETFSKSYVTDPLTLSKDSSIGIFNYLGYSLTSGYFFDQRKSLTESSSDIQSAQVQYASGAPRGHNLKGKVLIFGIPDNQLEPLRILQELTGTQTGAYFGASLLSLDVNGDGYDDLLVGAPRHSRDFGNRRRQASGRAGRMAIPMGRGFNLFKGSGDEGQVFLYLTDGNFLRNSQTLRGEGEYLQWAQFGTAMTSVGDLNKDGFNDFAISAPYESHSGVTGAVYIYHGSSNGRIAKAAQIIRALDIDNSLRGFGISLGGNVDVDNNGFNDIVIGSFNSSQTVILRSRRLITVYGKLVSNQDKLPLDLKEFEIKSCVSFTGDFGSGDVELTVNVTADINSRPRRIQLGLSASKLSTSIQYTLSLKLGIESCQRLFAQVIGSLESSSESVVIRQTILVLETGQSNRVRKRILEIQPDGSSTISGEAYTSFCSSCPMIDTSQDNQFDLKLPLAITCGDDDKCIADLSLDVSFKDLPDFEFTVGSAEDSTITMLVTLQNYGETAISPMVSIAWNKIKIRRWPSGCKCADKSGTSTVCECSLGKYLEANETKTVSLDLDVSSLIVDEMHFEPEILFSLNATTVSEMIKPEKRTVVLRLNALADIYIEGSKSLEVFNMDTQSRSLVFKQTYEVNMIGPSPIGQVEIVFDLPVNLTTVTGSVVNVYPVISDVKPDGIQMVCQATKGQFAKSEIVLFEEEEEDDPNFDVAGIGGPLTKEKEIKRKSNLTLIENERILIHCNSPFVTCIEVKCKTSAYLPGIHTTISFVMDMNVKTIISLLNDHKASAIQVESKGRIVLPDVIQKIQPVLQKADTDESITLIEKAEADWKKVSKWVYFLAVVVGVIVLICIGIILHYFGCFENKKSPPKETEDAVAEDAVDRQEEMVPLNEVSKTSSVIDVHDIPSPLSPPAFIPPEIPTIVEETVTDVEEDNGGTENGRVKLTEM